MHFLGFLCLWRYQEASCFTGEKRYEPSRSCRYGGSSCFRDAYTVSRSGRLNFPAAATGRSLGHLEDRCVTPNFVIRSEAEAKDSERVGPPIPSALLFHSSIEVPHPTIYSVVNDDT
jgi:hypothetical protein